MKKLLSVFIFIMSLNISYSQKLDLVITSSGDSIACHIDSITDSHIYLKWKNGYKWDNTYLPKSKQVKYQYGVIDKKLVVYKQATPYIHYLKKPITIEFLKNSIYGAVGSIALISSATIYYERIIGQRKKKAPPFVFGRFGIGGLRGGLEGQASYVSFNGGIFTGVENSHFELVAGLNIYFDELEGVFPAGGSVGYRFQKPNGSFIFRTGLGFPETIYISLGFSF